MCGHFLTLCMKALSRSYVWWLNIHRDIENFVGNCKDELQSDT